MKAQIVIYPPNRPLERVMKPSQVPILYENLFFIDINVNGEIILGSSNVAGTFWEGSLFHYRNISDAVENSYLGYYISNGSTSDAKFLNSTDFQLVLLAEDTGTLKLLNIPNTDAKQVMNILDVYDKSNRVEQISLWENNKVATCSETSIVLYDVTNGSSIKVNKKYENYHTDSLTSIDCNKSEPNIFASTSIDRRICVWDDRLENAAASVLYTNEFCTLTSVSWNTACPNQLVVGSEAGNIYLLDTKQPKDFLSVLHCFEEKIHRVLFNVSGNLAVCGDLPTVLVHSAKNNELITLYESSKHTAMVRGLAWHEEELYSCGFDKNIFSHTF